MPPFSNSRRGMHEPPPKRRRGLKSPTPFGTAAVPGKPIWLLRGPLIPASMPERNWMPIYRQAQHGKWRRLVFHRIAKRVWVAGAQTLVSLMPSPLPGRPRLSANTASNSAFY